MGRTCYKSGYVVGMKHTVPDDPAVIGEQDDVNPTGCSSLFCRKCGAHVRQVPRLFVAKEPRSLEDIYAVEDLSKLRWLKRDENARLYLCRCAYHVESGYGWNLLGDTDSNKLMVPMAWSCSGHPDASPPKRVQPGMAKKRQSKTPKRGAQSGAKSACSVCQGKGFLVCYVCQGEGVIRSQFHDDAPCTECQETGRRPCPTCAET